MAGTNPHAHLEPHRRPLNERERRALRAKADSLRRRSRRAMTRWLPIGLGVLALLWLWTILASDAPWIAVTMFWLVAGSLIGWWVRRDMRSHAGQFDDMATALQSALNGGVADVYDVCARALAEFEEVEDEGACYAFEIEGPRVVFVTGQEFYPGARFPSLDFSLVYVVDEAGRTVDVLIEKRGARAQPDFTVPGIRAQGPERPDHLEVRAGTLEAVMDGYNSASA
jgi:hypothetical protein